MADNWYYGRNGKRFGPIPEVQLKQLADSGQLQPSDLVWTKGMAAWTQAKVINGLIPTLSETPPPIPESMLSNPADDSPLTFLNAAQHTPAISNPYLHRSANRVEDSTESFLDTLNETSATPAKRIAQDATAFSQSDAIKQRLAVAKTMLFGAGKDQSANGPSESPSPSVNRSALPSCSNAMNDPTQPPASSVIAEAPVVYMGGHPDHIDNAEGVLRLTEAGVEFIPNSPGSPVRLVIGYEAVADITNIKGRLPDSYLEMLAAKAQKGKWLGFAASTAASFVPHVGSKVTSAIDKGVNKAVAGNGAGGQMPFNRICVVMRLDGTKYKVLYDALGDIPEAMEASAQRICNLSVKVRGRFGKPPSRPKNCSPTTQADETPTPQVKKIVACPKCKTKVRTAKPGIISCPKCQTKIRVSDTLFSK